MDDLSKETTEHEYQLLATQAEALGYAMRVLKRRNASKSFEILTRYFRSLAVVKGLSQEIAVPCDHSSHHPAGIDGYDQSEGDEMCDESQRDAPANLKTAQREARMYASRLARRGLD